MCSWCQSHQSGIPHSSPSASRSPQRITPHYREACQWRRTRSRGCSYCLVRWKILSFLSRLDTRASSPYRCSLSDWDVDRESRPKCSSPAYRIAYYCSCPHGWSCKHRQQPLQVYISPSCHRINVMCRGHKAHLAHIWIFPASGVLSLGSDQ